jgi:hypothetical protein
MDGGVPRLTFQQRMALIEALYRPYVCMYIRVCMLDKYDRSVSAHFLPA